MTDLFISYSRRDKDRVAPLVAALKAHGWSVWWDPAIAPGKDFDREIAAELQVASAVLVVWTENSVKSRWVRGEARDAADRGILVPVRFGEVPLPIDFRALHTVDFEASENAARSPRFNEVQQAIEVLVARAHGQQVAAAPSSPTVSPRVLAGAGPARLAICVLPFANLGGDATQEFFSDGLTEDIITELSRWRLLSVRSRSASFRYRGRAVEIDQMASELNVQFVVSGSVRRMGERIRINVQLIDALSGAQVWADRFDRPEAEFFKLQDQVVQTIVSTLVGRAQVTDTERARRKSPVSLEAYECVLKGNALPWDDPDGFAEAVRLFERAIEIDPAYGLAHALLSSMRCSQWRNDSNASATLLDEAYALARRAVELDDGESTCHSLLANTCVHRRSFDLAMQHMQRAVAINPNNQWNVADMGLLLLYTDRAEEALAWFARCKQIDPYFDAPWCWRAAGQANMVLRRFGEALAMFERIRLRTFRVAALMAACHARLGNAEQARTYAKECLAAFPHFSVQQYTAKELLQNSEQITYLAESMRLAGLPD